MALVSIVADLFGVVSGIYLAAVAGKSYLASKKENPDESETIKENDKQN